MLPKSALPVLSLIGGIVLLGVSLSRANAQITQPTAADPHPNLTIIVDTTTRDVVSALAAVGQGYYPQDTMSVFPDLSLGLGGVISIKRAQPIRLADGKREYTIRTWKHSVSDLLKEQNIPLGVDDKIVPAADSSLRSDTAIVITRVARTIVKDILTVAFKTLQQDDATIYRGQQVVAQTGKNGQLEKQYLVIREDGISVSQTLVSSAFLSKPVDKIIKIGTKLKIGRSYSGRATWYNCCGTKVASDKFPKGTEIQIVNISNGKKLIAKVDGCICGARPDLVVDLHPSYFTQLGGSLSDGIMPQMRIDEILN